jgi:short-subunit dehydrogenase
VTAVVVGASAGLGRALAGALAAAGHDLVLAASDPRDVEALATDLRLRHRVRAVAVAVDLASADADLEPLAAAAVSLGGAESLLLPIGWTTEPSLDGATVDPATAERLVRINFLSVVALVTRFLPSLRRCPGARIVGFGSVAAVRGRRVNLVYASAKSALRSYFEGLRIACADSPIRVQFWVPGYLDTNLAFGRSTPLPRADPAGLAARVVAHLSRGDLLLYHPWWWRLVCAAIPLVPFSLFKRLEG